MARSKTKARAAVVSEIQMMQQARLEIGKDKLNGKGKFAKMQESHIRTDKEKLDWKKANSTRKKLASRQAEVLIFYRYIIIYLYINPP